MRVSLLHRFVSVALIVPFVLAVTTFPVSAQVVQPTAAASGGLQGDRTVGELEGKRLAELTYGAGRVGFGLDLSRPSNSLKFPTLTFHVPSTSDDSQSQETLATGMLEGETLAASKGAGGKLGIGLAVGVLTGLIGTGIGYFVIGPEPMTAEAIQRQANKSAEYQMGFKAGWEQKTQTKKRNAFLAGGLLGTAAFVAILVSAQGQ